MPQSSASLSRQVGAVMTNPLINYGNKPILESEKPRLTYQQPTLTRLDYSEINAKGINVPEANSGLLES